MIFTDVLKKNQIIYINEDINYDELLDRAVTKLRSLFDIPYSKEECINEIKDRDKLGNIAFTEGFAIPHARFNNINGVHFVIVVTKKAVTISQPNKDKQINVLAIFLTSKSAPNLYLSILSGTVKLFNINKGKYLDKLKKAQNEEEIYNIFANSEIEIRHKIKVKDIMNYHNVIVYPEDNVKNVMNRLYTHQTSTAYVVDENENLIGYISIALLLKSVIPGYIEELGDISFVKEFEPFVKLLREESKVMVKELMSKIEYTLEPESSILEAAYYITKATESHIPVVEGGKLKGTIESKNFLNKILRS